MKIIKWLDDNLEEFLLMIIVASITIIMLLQIIMRKIFGTPLTWAEELCRYLFLWSGYLGLGYCFKKGINLKIDFLVDKLKEKPKKLLIILNQVILILFLLYIFIASIKTLGGVSELNQRSPALDIPMIYIYLAPVIGYGLGIIRFVQNLRKGK